MLVEARKLRERLEEASRSAPFCHGQALASRILDIAAFPHRQILYGLGPRELNCPS